MDTTISLWRRYFQIAKPGILMGNAITAFGGFVLASKGKFDPWLFAAMLCGLSSIIASACIFNNYIDKAADEKMDRTKNRGFVTGQISIKKGVALAVALGLIGTLSLVYFTNLLTTALALAGFFVYIVLYTFLKYRSVHATLVGSFAGAAPPAIGYCAVSGRFDLCACLLFAMIMLWQMPHFYAIAIFRMEDYRKAAIPVLPLKKGVRATKMYMAAYILAFSASSSLLTFFHYTGALFLIASALLSAAWFCLCIKGFSCRNDSVWARQMFVFSLIVVSVLSLIIPFS